MPIHSITVDDVTLKVYESFSHYEQLENAQFHWQDLNGNDVEVETSSISSGMSRDHFEEDTECKPDGIYWHAETEERNIVAIIVSKEVPMSFSSLLETIGHEYGHIIDATPFKNSTSSYETDEGYRQEEEKAQAFGKFAKNSYEMAKYMRMMLKSHDINITE